jgi:hypothetical protein
MGEYARRKSDGVEVKIGTCSRMYYLRYENRNDVTQLPHSLHPGKELDLIFRLPFPDENKVPIGEYQKYDRSIELKNFNLNTDDDDAGTIQLKHESGVLVNVSCHHGNRLPDITGEAKALWNGKTTVNFKLIGVKSTAGGLLPVVACKWCNLTWSLAEWDKVLSCVSDNELRIKLEFYQFM